MRKKGISPVVAMALFLVITVVSVVGFSQFLNSYESEILSDIEQQESVNDINIRDVVGSVAYIEAQKAINLSSIKIQGRDCSLNPQLSKGINKVDLTSCTGNLTTSTPELTLVSNVGIISKEVFLEQRGISVFIKDFETDFTGIVSSTFQGLALLSTGEIAVSGFDESASQERFIVKKLDGQGNEIWEYAHNSGATGISEQSDDVIEHSDGSIIASGRIYNGSDEEMFAVKLNSDTGAEIWNYSSTEGEDYRRGQIIELADGNLALAGRGSFSGDRDIYLVKLDKDTGEEIWTTQYENAGADANLGLVELNNGSILVAGIATVSDVDQLLLLFDENGTAVLNKTMDSGLGTDQIWGIKTAKDGNILVTGFFGGDISIQKITPDLVNIWNTTYDFGFGNDFAFGIDEFDNGDIVVAGRMIDINSDLFAVLLKVNSTGSELFNVTYTDNSASGNNFIDPQITADGGILVAGIGYNGSQTYSVIVKTDPLGISCSTNLTAGCFSYR